MTIPVAPPSPHSTGRRPSVQRNSPRVSSTQNYSPHIATATDGLQKLNPPPYNRQHPPPPPPPRRGSTSSGGGQRTRSKSRERTNNPSSAMPTQELRRGRSNSDASGGSSSRQRSRSNSFQNEVPGQELRRSINSEGSSSRRRSRSRSNSFQNEHSMPTTQDLRRGRSNSDASAGGTRRSRSRSNSFQNEQSSSNTSHNKRGSNSSARSRSRSNSRSRRPSHNDNETLANEYNIAKREMQKDTLLNSYNNRTGSFEGHNSYNRTGSTESHHSHGSRRSSSRERNRFNSVPLTPMQNEESEDEYSENGREEQINDEETSFSDDGNCIARICSTILCIFPKIEPLPWATFAVLTVWCGIPPACFILFFSVSTILLHYYQELVWLAPVSKNSLFPLNSKWDSGKKYTTKLQ